MMKNDIVLRAEGISIAFDIGSYTRKGKILNLFSSLFRNKIQRDLFWALSEINIDVHQGELISVIGRNGAGKSTLARILSGIYTPTTGHVLCNGVITSLFSLAGSFQRNNDLSGRENIINFCNHHNLPEEKVNEITKDIIEISELGEFIDLPVKTYSSGMQGRLSFSMALFLEGEILILDEVLSAGDQAFTKKAGSILKMFKERGTTIVYITHAIFSARTLSDRVLWLDEGRIKMFGDPNTVCDAYNDFVFGASGSLRTLK